MIKALVFAAILSVCVGHPNEAEAIKSLNEVENLQIIGDFVTIASKNSSEYHSAKCDGFDEYLHTHVIRIKVPLLQDRYFHFELNNLVWDDKGVEGRKKGMRIREILLPLLLAVKYKLTVVLPIFMAFVLGLALKGAWAGMTGLLISKLVALKVLLQAQNKQDENHNEDQEDDDEQSDHHSHEEDHEDDPQPVIIHLDGHPGKFSRRRKESNKIRRYYSPKRWNE